MKKNDSITHLMSSEIKSIQVGQSLSDVHRLMGELAIHHVPIVEGKKLVGLVSYTDILALDLVIYGATEHTIGAIIDQQFLLKDVMTTKLTTLSNKDNIRRAAEILANGEFHSLPVIDEESNLVGIVTSTDLIRYLRDQY